MIDTKIIGLHIKELRRRQGLTQGQFAEVLSVSFQAVSNWERGIAPPDLENLVRIAAYFGVLVDDLLRPKQETVFLGIDGGGTKTEFVAVTSEGYVLKRLTKPGCNPNDIGYSRALALLTEGIGEILSELPNVTAIFGGIAGIAAGDHAKRLYADLKKCYPGITLQIKNDSANLFAFDDRADMAVISGTGSVVFVKSGDAYRRIGGWGYLLSPGGSAYEIGRDLLAEALREEDAMEKPSLLRRLLCERIGTPTVWEHVHTVYNRGKPYVAELASIAFDAYREGDQAAREIIDRNARILADQLNDGIRLYGASPVAIASGGLFQHQREIMQRHVSAYTPTELIHTELPPVFGACKNACRLCGELPTDFYETFKNTYGGANQ